MLSALTLVIAAQSAAAQQPLQVETVDRGYRITASEPIPIEDMEILQARLDALAGATCGNLTLRWGRYTHVNVPNPDGTTSVGSYVQNFKCIDPATDPYKPVSADWKPGDADIIAARNVGERYVQAIIDGDPEAGLALLDPEIGVTPDEWLEFTRAVVDPGEGSVGIAVEGWEANPANMPYPGGYISQFYQGDFDRFAKYCISLILYRLDDAKYQVSQMNSMAVLKSQVADGTYTASQLAGICT